MLSITRLVILLVLLIAQPTIAQIIYLGRDADGNPTASKEPPPGMDTTPVPLNPQPPKASKVPLKSKATAQRQSSANEGAKQAADATSDLVLYAASWCPHCRGARKYLREHGISYTDVDIETASGKRAYADVNEGQGIPLLVAGEQRAVGFGEDYYKWFLKRRLAN